MQNCSGAVVVFGSLKHINLILIVLFCLICRFDKIINKEIPSKIVYEDDKVLRCFWPTTSNVLFFGSFDS